MFQFYVPLSLFNTDLTLIYPLYNPIIVVSILFSIIQQRVLSDALGPGSERQREGFVQVDLLRNLH